MRLPEGVPLGRPSLSNGADSDKNVRPFENVVLFGSYEHDTIRSPVVFQRLACLKGPSGVFNNDNNILSEIREIILNIVAIGEVIISSEPLRI